MHSVTITEQTRAQVERAERAAEEARSRSQASRRGGVKPAPEGDHGFPARDEDQALDHGAD